MTNSISTQLSDEQINYGGVLFDNIVNNVYYQLLLAQMQSGKTGTYLFTACELLRIGIKKKVIIISGNRERALKNQTVNIVPFLTKYENYLTKLGHIVGYKILTELASNITVVWGGDLKKAFISDNSLIIIDESHYGQDYNQQLNQFLIKSGLSATGNIEELKSKNIHIISVSATPFSEIAANNNKSQSKEIIRFVPSSQYKSVKNMVDAGLINGYDDWTGCLGDNMFLIPSSEPSYAIIRVSSNKYDEVIQIANNNNWDHKIYDTTSKTHKKIESLNDDLSIKPTKNTLIILNQGCRMGSVLTKTYIKFCIETTASMKTDTLLQSLIGRCCGYHNFKIKLFIPNKIYNNGEIQKYINLMDNPIIELQNIPLKARNIVNKRELNPDKKNRYPMIPHKLIFNGKDEASIQKYICANINNIYNTNTSYVTIVDLNDSQEQRDEINKMCEQYEKQETAQLQPVNKINISSKNINYDKDDKHDKSGNKTYADFPEKLHNSITQKIPMKFGSSLGNSAKEIEIVIYVFERNFPKYGFKKGDVYLQTTVETRGNYEYYDNNNIIETTGVEMFANREEAVSHTLETGEIVKANGHYPITLQPETAESVELMGKAITYLIGISIDCENVGLNVPRRVLSIYDKNNKFKGILVNREVLTALNPNGRIYNMINKYFDGIKIRLKIGPQLVLLNKDGIPEPLSVRLKEISW